MRTLSGVRIAAATRASMAAPAEATPADTGKDTAPISDGLRELRRAAAEVARRFPPMTAEQAAVVRRALRKQRR